MSEQRNIIIALSRRNVIGATCIEFLALLGILAGGTLGFHLGIKFGWLGAIVGAVIGAVIGLPLGALSFSLLILIFELEERVKKLAVKIFEKSKSRD